MSAIKHSTSLATGIVLLLLIPGMAANAQQKSRNSIYVSLDSRGPVYSINYDRIFRLGQRTDYSASAGFSIVKNAVAFPVGLHFITAPGSHHLEYGITVTPYIDYNLHLDGSNKDESDKYIYINPGIGYRYQPAQTGLFFKAVIGPSIFLDPPSDDFWDMDPKLYGYGSVCIGVSF